MLLSWSVCVWGGGCLSSIPKHPIFLIDLNCSTICIFTLQASSGQDLVFIISLFSAFCALSGTLQAPSKCFRIYSGSWSISCYPKGDSQFLEFHQKAAIIPFIFVQGLYLFKMLCHSFHLILKYLSDRWAYLLLPTKALTGQSLQLSHTNFSAHNMVIFQR